MKTTEIFRYLNKIGFADQVHFRDGNQMVFYHWNAQMSDLIPSLTIEGNRIERIYYPRKFMPLIYKITPENIDNDFQDEGFIRDYRSKRNG